MPNTTAAFGVEVRLQFLTDVAPYNVVDIRCKWDITIKQGLSRKCTHAHARSRDYTYKYLSFCSTLCKRQSISMQQSVIKLDLFVQYLTEKAYSYCRSDGNACRNCKLLIRKRGHLAGARTRDCRNRATSSTALALHLIQWLVLSRQPKLDYGQYGNTANTILYANTYICIHCIHTCVQLYAHINT